MNRCFSRGAFGAIAAAGILLSAEAYEDYYLTTTDSAVTRRIVGGDVVYTFANPSAGTVTATLKESATLARYLVVGGGGAGGWTIGGGGGGGGCAEASPAAALAANTVLSITVGAGGDPLPNAPGTTWPCGGNGGSTTLAFGDTTVTSLGGGGGGSWSNSSPNTGALACGGGCSNGNKTTNPSDTTYAFFSGGVSVGHCSGGGGGVCGVGFAGSGTNAGAGGPGFVSDITGESLDYGAGGGGGAGNDCATFGAAGGKSAGAGGAKNASQRGVSGLAGRGGGGGGGGFSGATCGGAGGCGSVILRLTPENLVAEVTDAKAKYRSDGRLTLTASLLPFDAGSAVVKLRWGTDPDNLTEVDVLAASPSATNQAVSKQLTGLTANETIYWQFVTEHTKGEVKFTTSTTRASVYTSFVPTDAATPVYTVNVAASTTVDLTAWMEENAVASISGAGTIVKTGEGTLTVTNGVLKDFTGDVYVVRGGKIVTKAANPLGTTAGKVCVEDGASLQPYDEWAFGAKPVYGEGWGVGGNSAFILGTSTASKEHFLPTKIYLTGDARIRITDGKHTSTSPTIDMGGHTLRFCGGSSWDYTAFSFTNPGHVIFESWFLCTGGTWNGDETNTLTIPNGSALRGNNWTSTKNWTVDFKSGSVIYAGQGACSWHGPVVLEDHIVLQRQFENSYWSFYGPVSGPGGIGKSNNHALAGVFLMGTENTFHGGVYLNTDRLRLQGNGSLPRDGAALTNLNGRVEFYTAGPYELPEGYFSGTGIVQNVSAGALATGTWKNRLVKDGAGELIYDAAIGSDRLEVRQGSLYFPSATVADWPFFTNVQVKAGGSVRFGAAGAWQVGNLVSGAGTVNGDVSAKGFAVDAAAATDATLTVSGTLAFANDAEVIVPAALPHLGSSVYTLVKAASISGLPKSANEKWYTQVVDNGDSTQSLQLVYGCGLKIFIR